MNTVKTSSFVAVILMVSYFGVCLKTFQEKREWFSEHRAKNSCAFTATLKKIRRQIRRRDGIIPLKPSSGQCLSGNCTSFCSFRKLRSADLRMKFELIVVAGALTLAELGPAQKVSSH